MRVLALDLSSSCTGFALLEGEFGNIPKIIEMDSVKSTGSILGFGNNSYPWDYYYGIEARADAVWSAIRRLEYDTIVIEETNSSKARYTQKILEWLHFAVLARVRDDAKPVYYINTGDWRRNLGQSVTKEDRKANATVRKLKKSGDKEALKVLGLKGKITRKHVSVRYVNSTYGLSLKIGQNDIADALSIGTAYFMGVRTCNGK